MPLISTIIMRLIKWVPYSILEGNKQHVERHGTWIIQYYYTYYRIVVLLSRGIANSVNNPYVDKYLCYNTFEGTLDPQVLITTNVKRMSVLIHMSIKIFKIYGTRISYVCTYIYIPRICKWMHSIKNFLLGTSTIIPNKVTYVGSGRLCRHSWKHNR